MFEQITNPHLNKTIVATLRQPIRTRDVEVLKAYHRITMSLKTMLSKHISLKQQKYFEWCWQWQIHHNNLIKEFVCQFCSVKLYLSQDEYLITFTLSAHNFQSGTGLNSNALLRVAFKHTGNDQSSLAIEICLNIVLTRNPEEYFDKKAEEYEEQSKIWFNKKY